MMNWLATIMIVFVIVLLVGTVFSVSGLRGPWPGTVWFFLILLLGTLSISVWATPFGPRVWGVPWLEFLVTATFIGLLIAASTPERGPKRTYIKELPLERDTAGDGVEPATPLHPHKTTGDALVTTTTLTAFFWVFAILALALIFIRFFSELTP
jgi:hypothetical protein